MPTTFLNTTRRKGFALIVSISLMAFILLLMLSLSSLVMVETSTTEIKTRQEEARQNAILALNTALGELQLYAGPDKRVTATGDIMDRADSLDDGRRYWTGVWESASEELVSTSGGRQVKPGAGNHLAWLLSLSNSTGNRINAPANILGANPVDASWETQTLVGENSAGPDGEIAVGLIPVKRDGQIEGAIGWWIGDEGVKAKFNLEKPLPGETVKTGNAPTWLPAQPGTGIITVNDSSSTFISQRENVDDLSRTIDRENLKAAFNTVEGKAFPKNRFHDISAHSKGLLVDVTTGRLKQDLSHIFQHDALFDQFFPSRGRAAQFRQDDAFDQFLTSSFTEDIHLPNMRILRDYALLPEQISDGKLTEIPQMRDGTWMRNTTETGQSNPQVAGTIPYAKSYHENSSVTLVDARAQMSVSMDFINDNAPAPELLPNGNTKYYQAIRMKLTPIVALYNPYNIPIESVGAYLTSFINPEVSIKVGTNPTVNFNLAEVMPPNWRSSSGTIDSDYRNRQVASAYTQPRIPATTFDPGETLIFSLNDSGYMYEEYEAVFSNRWRWGNVRRPRALDMVNDTTINKAFWMPLNADYIPIALQDGNDPDDTLSGRDTYGDLFLGTGRLRPKFGLTTTERNNLYVSYEQAPDGTVVGADSLSVSIVFSNVPSVSEIIIREDNGSSYWPAIETSQSLERHGIMLNGLEPSGSTLSSTELFVDYQQAALRPSLGTWRQGLRTITESDDPIRMMDANFRAVITQGDWEGDEETSPGTDLSNSLPYSTYGNNYGRVLNSDWEMTGESSNGKYRAFWGKSIDGSDNTTNVILFDIPREETISLGAFQHANMGRYPFHPNYIIGQSYLPPLLQPDTAWRSYSFEAYDGSGNTDAPAIDLSYVLNHGLWDRYFLSTIPQDLDDTELEDLRRGESYLPNSRLKFAATSSPAVADYISSSAANFNVTTPELSDLPFNTVASQLYVDGAFNVNSTSVEAWKALLWSVHDREIDIYNPKTGVTSTQTIPGALYSRLTTAYGDDTELYTGLRSLSEAQVEELAEAIVAQIKARGPFGSMGDFINRSLSEAALPEHKNSGALQAAIDSTSINQSVVAESGNAPLDTYGSLYANTPDGPQGAGLPGFLTQGDLLQALGPVLTARSDTFIIRAYGDSRDPISGRVEASATLEAIVQRTPSPVADGDLTEEELTAQTIQSPEAFGRRFKVVAFKWLTSTDI
ncbi:hypothetical protein H5P28_15670 [Ruficoccus amylovorans]|uniref:Verru_Chthon cassette protein A n=1 Tax=Ruficoccus amylovorans TaxID=1804625 RepID=A0A842HG92_9BACT|nr:hypothetical protein [Ruficoccus amylovorans]MBC2595705.1 hypothetical protein [Ruficoccus amylovorans]